MKVSIVVPVFNEEENVAPLHREIVAALKKLSYDYEIIFVNDGSSDKTLSNLKKLKPVVIVEFRKNFGQTASMDAGIKQATGDVIITMDGDRQNDPADISKLLKKIEEGYDVVSGWRFNRKDSFSKKFTSRGANFLRGKIINDGIHDSGCTLKAYRKECFADLDLYGEMHRFIPGVLKWHGFKIAEIKVNHRARVAGVTKYNAKRTVKGLLDMISVWFWRKYSARPLHLFGGLGSLFLIVGATLLVTLSVLRLMGAISLSSSIWPLTGFFLLLVGVQLLVSGLMADATMKSYYRIHEISPYSIKEVIRN